MMPQLVLPDVPASGLRFPESLGQTGLLVGWSLEKYAPKRAIGFNYGDPAKVPATGYIDPVLLSGEGHLITIAPTGAGKGVGCIVPALLRHEGPVIVIDPKGENVAITARHRREMGQEVIVLDPLGITDFSASQLNPLDLIDLDSVSAVDDAAILASALSGGANLSNDRFWHARAEHLVIGVILHVLATQPVGEANLTAVRDLVNRAVGDPERLIREMRESEHPEVVRTIDALSIKADTTLGGILAVAQDLVDFMRGPLLQHATARSAFDIDDITRGKPMSVYIVIPPHMMESHGRMLRLWISMLMSAITRRRAKPPKATLFILDEAAQLGTLSQLRQSLTLLRGYGLQTWSFWQDVSQLQMLYPLDWRTMVNNCRVVQSFGALNMTAAQEMAEFTGFGDARRVIDLSQDEMILQLAGDEAVVARLPNYRFDPPFAGQFDANPYYANDRDIMPKTVAAVKFYDRALRDGDLRYKHGTLSGSAAKPDPNDPRLKEVDPLLRRLLDRF